MTVDKAGFERLQEEEKEKNKRGGRAEAKDMLMMAKETVHLVSTGVPVTNQARNEMIK